MGFSKLVEYEEAPTPPPNDLESDEPPMETHLHMMQLLDLLESLSWHWRDRDDYFASGNLTVYFSEDQVKNRDFRGPDFFVVRGVDPRPRKSWMVWAEGGRAPDVVNLSDMMFARFASRGAFVDLSPYLPADPSGRTGAP